VDSSGGLLRRTTEDVKVRAAIGARLGVCRAMVRATRRRNIISVVWRGEGATCGGESSCWSLEDIAGEVVRCLVASHARDYLTRTKQNSYI
jgi:hypothetical protein